MEDSEIEQRVCRFWGSSIVVWIWSEWRLYFVYFYWFWGVSFQGPTSPRVSAYWHCSHGPLIPGELNPWSIDPTEHWFLQSFILGRLLQGGIPLGWMPLGWNTCTRTGGQRHRGARECSEGCRLHFHPQCPGCKEGRIGWSNCHDG